MIEIRFGKRTLLAALLLAAAMAVLPSCATMENMLAAVGLADKPAAPDTPDAMVLQGLDEFNHARYSAALKVFEEIKERFPFSRYSLLAELKSADCKYYMGDYSEARTLYEEFETNHPTNEAVAYVMFQIGMCHYQQIGTIDRDTTGAVNAIQAFSRLIRSYPDSPYIAEARARLQAARDFLAKHEMYVAAFYVRTEEYDQAEGRLAFLLENFPESSVAPRAKELLAAIRSGNPPQRTWRDWLPDISLPDWKSFIGGLRMGGASASSAPSEPNSD